MMSEVILILEPSVDSSDLSFDIFIYFFPYQGPNRVLNALPGSKAAHVMRAYMCLRIQTNKWAPKWFAKDTHFKRHNTHAGAGKWNTSLHAFICTLKSDANIRELLRCSCWTCIKEILHPSNNHHFLALHTGTSLTELKGQFTQNWNLMHLLLSTTQCQWSSLKLVVYEFLYCTRPSNAILCYPP